MLLGGCKFLSPAAAAVEVDVEAPIQAMTAPVVFSIVPDSGASIFAS